MNFFNVCANKLYLSEPEEGPPVPPGLGAPGKKGPPNLSEYLRYGI